MAAEIVSVVFDGFAGELFFDDKVVRISVYVTQIVDRCRCYRRIRRREALCGFGRHDAHETKAVVVHVIGVGIVVVGDFATFENHIVLLVGEGYDLAAVLVG